MKTPNERTAKFMGEKYALPYDERWELLMDVVKRITPLAKALGQQAWFDVRYSLVNADIKSVHKRAVEFIDWYDTQ